jgi:hypothetical protein
MSRSGILRAFARYTENWRDLRDEIRTERILNSLPQDIRKDIGWPGIYAEQRIGKAGRPRSS